MNKRILLWGLAVSLAFPGVVNAALIDRGSGLIYDDVLDITWLQDANYAMTSSFDADGAMTWSDANAWAAGLTFGGFSDWRLPTLSPVGGSTTFNTIVSNNATTDLGYADSTGWVDGSGTPVSEMGYMYYVNLGNLGLCTPNDANPATCTTQAGSGLNNSSFIDGVTGATVSFSNIQSFNSWSGLGFAPMPNLAWSFDFQFGRQDKGSKTDNNFFAWAVRSGDVVALSVPEPGTLILLCIGLAGIGLNKRLWCQLPH